VYMRLSRHKGCICFKTRLGKGKRLKTQTQSEQNLSNSDTTRNTEEKELLQGKKSPIMFSMAKGKPQQTGMTAEINSIPTYAI
jgi:hypothetical protein